MPLVCEWVNVDNIALSRPPLFSGAVSRSTVELSGMAGTQT